MVLHGFPGGPSPGRHWRWWGRSKKCAKGWGACLRRGRPSSSSGAGGQSGNGARTRIDIWASVLPFKPSGQHRPSGPFEEAQRPGGGPSPLGGCGYSPCEFFPVPGVPSSSPLRWPRVGVSFGHSAFGHRGSWSSARRERVGKFSKDRGGRVW